MLQPDDYYLHKGTIPWLNLGFAAALTPALLACWATFFFRIYR